MLNKDFQDMLSCLNARGAEYLLIGGYALAVHGVPRATGDMDVLVNPTRENAMKVYLALADFGAPLLELIADDFASEGISFQIGIAPRKIDILTSISGVSFEEAWKSKLAVEISGLKINVLGREEFIKNKKASGRPKDLLDISLLEGE